MRFIHAAKGFFLGWRSVVTDDESARFRRAVFQKHRGMRYYCSLVGDAYLAV